MEMAYDHADELEKAKQLKQRHLLLNGARDVDGIHQFALGKLEEFGSVPEVPQLLGKEQWTSLCEAKKGSLCALAFLPHILDSGKDGRNAYIETLVSVAKKTRPLPFHFVWSEGAAQPALEESLGGFGSGCELAADRTQS